MLMITLPFDVRDLSIDATKFVKTIPAYLGIHKTKALVSFLFLLCISLCIIPLVDNNITTGIWPMIGLLISNLLVYTAIKITWNKKDDVLYSGLLDGMIIIRGLIICGLAVI